MLNFDTIEKRLSRVKIQHITDPKFITGHYYVRATYALKEVAEKIASHQSTAASVYTPRNLLGRCSARVDAVRPLKSKYEGVITLSFPVELFGDIVYSGDILHILSGAVQNDESQHQFLYLLDIEIPKKVVATFPGPRYGTELFTDTKQPIIGTIIKPCSGITLKEYEKIVTDLVAIEELRFIKEDENLFPSFSHCPLAERAKIAAKIISRSGRKVIYAPHISSRPLDFFKNLEIVAAAGLPAVMFSETYYGGLVRDARDYVRDHSFDIAIYAHNGGIGGRTKTINRVLLDRFARFDGADLRQTAPSGENCYLRPLPWQRELVEQALTTESIKMKKTICVRAGGLDQGNLLLNLRECQSNLQEYLFLMGSAINSIVDTRGRHTPQVAVAAINDLIALYDKGIFFKSVPALYTFAKKNKLSALSTCLKQRYAL